VYDGGDRRRTGLKGDGCAIFFKHDRFSQVAYKSLEYNDLAEGLYGAEFDEMCRDNVAQIIALVFREDGNSSNTSSNDSSSDSNGNTQESNSNSNSSNIGNSNSASTNCDEKKGVIITNTHLFWNYRYSYPRLRQATMLIEQTVDFNKTFNFPVILCGDWNMTPNSSVYKALTEGIICEDKISDFYFSLEVMENANVNVAKGLAAVTNDKPSPKQEEFNHKRREAVQKIIMASKSTLPLLESMYKNYTTITNHYYPEPKYWDGEPPYTNVTESWKGTLDYIFNFAPKYCERYKHKLIPTKVLEIPPYSKLIVHKGIPDLEYSSDHICIMCEYILQ